MRKLSKREGGYQRENRRAVGRSMQQGVLIKGNTNIEQYIREKQQQHQLRKSEALRTLNLLSDSNRSDLFMKLMAMTLNEASASMMPWHDIVGLRRTELNQMSQNEQEFEERKRRKRVFMRQLPRGYS